jgi:competence ComEA-like helix-hairpin-helix protein
MACVKKREDETNENKLNKRKIRIFLFVSFLFVCFAFSLLPSAAAARQEERININTASMGELMRIPGVGPALAARIIEYRQKHGGFKRPQEIIIVRGMSAKHYRQISHLIRI